MPEFTLDQYSSMLTYVACVLISATIYRYRHLIGMIVIILFGASWLWAAAMAVSMLKDNTSLQEHFKNKFWDVSNVIFNNFNPTQHNTL